MSQKKGKSWRLPSTNFRASRTNSVLRLLFCNCKQRQEKKRAACGRKHKNEIFSFQFLHFLFSPFFPTSFCCGHRGSASIFFWSKSLGTVVLGSKVRWPETSCRKNAEGTHKNNLYAREGKKAQCVVPYVPRGGYLSPLSKLCANSDMFAQILTNKGFPFLPAAELRTRSSLSFRLVEAISGH